MLIMECIDPRWVEASEPFVILFSDDRPFTWKEIFAWGKDSRIGKIASRQVIAYLEYRSLIWCDLTCKPVLWAKCGDWTVEQAMQSMRDGETTGFTGRERRANEDVSTQGAGAVFASSRSGMTAKVGSGS